MNFYFFSVPKVSNGFIIKLQQRYPTFQQTKIGQCRFRYLQLLQFFLWVAALNITVYTYSVNLGRFISFMVRMHIIREIALQCLMLLSDGQMCKNITFV